MTAFGFTKKGEETTPENSNTPSIDLAGIPKGEIVNDPVREQDAIRRAEQSGFTDRGQGRTIIRRKRVAQPQATVYVKGPEDLIQWFISYTAKQGHAAYWNSLEDFRDLVEGKK